MAAKKDKDSASISSIFSTAAERTRAFDAVIEGLPVAVRGRRPPGATYWRKWDALEFIRDPKHVSPDWSSGYWPKNARPTK